MKSTCISFGFILLKDTFHKSTSSEDQLSEHQECAYGLAVTLGIVSKHINLITHVRLC